LYLLSDVDGLTEEKAEKLVKKLFLAILDKLIINKKRERGAVWCLKYQTVSA
jgi:hypothetical protein